MKKLFFLLPILLLADVDPFSVGINSNSTYGLTPQEKAIVKNKKDIAKLKIQVENLNDELDKLKLKFANYDDLISQKLSGLSTILDELKVLRDDVVKIKKHNELQDENITLINQKITNLENEIEAIKESIKEITKIQNQNFNNLKSAIEQILKSIKEKSKPLSAKEAFYKAKKLYFSNKLDEAKKLFLYSLEKNYLPATSSYYLGEIAYKKGNYKEALAFYKKSVTIYPKKTSFTPRLLYHTAISFLKLNQKKNAKLTFLKLIHDFPDSKYASLAKKELEKLN